MAMRTIDNSNDDEDVLDELFDDEFRAELEAAFPGIHFITDEEAMEMVEADAQRYFGLGAMEFINRWKRQDFSKDDRCRAWEISTMIPGKYR